MPYYFQKVTNMSQIRHRNSVHKPHVKIEDTPQIHYKNTTDYNL
jgi:hypothetical protein